MKLCDYIKQITTKSFNIINSAFKNNLLKLFTLSQKSYQHFISILIWIWSKIEVFGKKLFWLLSASLIVLAVFNLVGNSFQQNIVLEQIDLPEDYIQKGYSSDNIIKNSISETFELAHTNQNKDKKIVQFVFNQHKNQIWECGSERTEIITNKLSTLINANLSLDLDNLKIVTPEKDISLELILDYLKKLTGKSNIHIKPSIINVGPSQSYLTTVSVKYPDNYYSSSEIRSRSFEEAKLNLTMLILKHFNPSLYALKVFNTNPIEAENAILDAVTHNPSFENSSLPYTLLGYLYYESNKADIKKSQLYFEKAINIDNNDQLALWGKSMINRLLITKKLNMTSTESLNNEDLDVANHLIDGKDYALQGYILKAFIYESENNIDEAINTYKSAMELFSRDSEVFMEYASALISQRKYEEARELIEEQEKYERESKNIKGYNYVTYQSILLTYLENFYTLEKLKPNILNLDKCNLERWIYYIHTEYNRVQFPLTLKAYLSEHLEYLYVLGERRGINNAEFYNSWGSYLTDKGDLNKALEKHMNALRLNENNLKTNQNIASTFMKMDQFKEASYFFNKIIIKTNDPNFIFLYLESIFKSNDYSRYINEFKKWSEDLNKQDFITKYNHSLSMAGLSFCNMKNKREAAKLHGLITDEEVRKSEAFNQLSMCISQKKPNN